MNWVVLAALLFTFGFFVAWAISPNLRVWIERPKYRFLSSVDNHDRYLRTGKTE